MLYGRAEIPAWFVILGLGALLAPPGIATTVLLIAFGLACIPAVISIGVWKRTAPGNLTSSGDLPPSRRWRFREPRLVGGLKPSGYREPTAGVIRLWHAARRMPKAIDAEFVAEDVTPERLHP